MAGALVVTLGGADRPAAQRGLIDANPAKDAARPRTTRSTPFSPSADEVRALLAVVTLRLHYDGRTDVGKRKATTALER